MENRKNGMAQIYFLPYAKSDEKYLIQLTNELYLEYAHRSATIVFCVRLTTAESLGASIQHLIAQCMAVASVQNFDTVVCIVSPTDYAKMEDFYSSAEGKPLVAVHANGWHFLPAPISIGISKTTELFVLDRTLRLTPVAA